MPKRTAKKNGSAHDIPVADHLEKDERAVCGYCGSRFEGDEVVIERELLGRKWRFCSPECLSSFSEEVHFQDEERDGDDEDVQLPSTDN